MFDEQLTFINAFMLKFAIFDLMKGCPLKTANIKAADLKQHLFLKNSMN